MEIKTNVNTGMKIWDKPSYQIIDPFTLSMAREGCKKSIAEIKEINEHNERVSTVLNKL